MKKQKKHFPWKDGKTEQYEKAELLVMEILEDPKVDPEAVHLWKDPAFERYTVEWEVV